MKIIHYFGFILLVFLLSNCGSNKRQESVNYSGLKNVRSIDNWNVKGKVSIKSRNRASTVLFVWEQEQDTFSVSMNGPLGIGFIELEGVIGEVTLRNAKGEFSAPTAEILLQQFTELDLPVSFLRYWILGVPQNKIKARKINYDDNRVIQSFEQVGWSVDYVSRDSIVNAEKEQFYLPRKMIIAKGDIKATILLKNWQL